jgi:ABC-type multidrug transport system ATPase subunit
MPILNARNISKRYGKQFALKDMDLSIKKGEIFGFLGPNGAGKTTFIKIMLGLATPLEGELELMGVDIFRNRREAINQVGAVVEAPIFFEYMTALENLTYLVALTEKLSKKRILEVLDMVGLSAAANKRVGAFSYGMKQRLGIAQALLPNTRFLILDEPTNGLDPHGISGVRDLIRKLSKELGVTIFLSSHLLIEVEQVCDRVCIIHHGEKVLEGIVADMLKSEQTIIELKAPKPLNLEAWEVIQKKSDDGLMRVIFELENDAVPQLIKDLIDQEAEIYKVNRVERNLEDIFIDLTKDSNLDVRVDSFGN